MVENCAVDPGVLEDITGQDNLFPELDYRVYRPDFRATLELETPATAP
jgi:hypothetical protein